MLNESIPTASASTASSTVLRMTTSPLSSCPDSSTLIGTKESKPNSMSWVVISVPLLRREKFLIAVWSRGRRGREPEELAEAVDHKGSALHLGDGLAPDDLVLSRELA